MDALVSSDTPATPSTIVALFASSSKIGISRAGGSRSRAGVSVGGSEHTGTGIETIRVFHNGINVTPQSLLHAVSAPRNGRNPSSEEHTKRPSAASNRGAIPRKKSSTLSNAQSAAATVRGERGGGTGGKSPGRRKRDGQVDEGGLTEEDLNALITVGLAETSTTILLEIRGSAVATDLREFSRYQQEKRQYEKMLQERVGSDKYTSRYAQTINWALKTKEVTVAAPATKEASCAANTWEIFDEQMKGMDQGTTDDGVFGGGAGSNPDGGDAEETAIQRQARELATVTLASHGCLLETENTVAPPPLPQDATIEGSRSNGVQGWGGGAPGTTPLNPNAGKARGAGRTGGGGGGAGGAGSTGARKANTGKTSESSVGTIAIMGGGASKMHIDGPEWVGEESESPMDARGVAEVLTARQAEKIMVSKELLASLELVERSLVQNLFHGKQLEYRNLPPVEVPEAVALGNGIDEQGRSESWESMSSSTKQDEGPSKNVDLKLLWTHKYPWGVSDKEAGGSASNGEGDEVKDKVPVPGEGSHGVRIEDGEGAARSGGGEPGREGPWRSRGEESPRADSALDGGGAAGGETAERTRRDRIVTAICFHQLNGDVIAVGYGAFFYSPDVHEGGLVLFWSVRNPEYPERTIRTPCSVTSLDFSERHPTLLAVGMYDGTIGIYDTARERENFSVAVAENSTSPGKHTDPVWQVKWVNKGVERGETLVSISTDGRVVEWSMKKGLSFSPLMLLKRIGNTQGVISRQASGLSFDFPPGDSATYFAGTEDGLIHKCSVSYNEQYLETYHGHTAPVYRIRCSPFYGGLFLSCSADWTVRLWEERQVEPLHTLRSIDLWDAVNDVAWSPTCSTVFASVAADGRVELWDLAQSVLDPIVSTATNRTGQDGSDVKSTENLSPSVDGTTTAGFSPRGRDTRETDTRSEFGVVSPQSPAARSQARASGMSSAVASLAEGSGSCPPVVTPRGVELTAVAFAAKVPVLAVGNSRGCVDVYKIVGVDLTPDATRKEQVERLRKTVMETDTKK